MLQKKRDQNRKSKANVDKHSGVSARRSKLVRAPFEKAPQFTQKKRKGETKKMAVSPPTN